MKVKHLPKQHKNYRENRIIYVLFSPNKKLFYINLCLENSLKETYRHNLKGRRQSTKNFIDELKPSRPCLFILEKIQNSTEQEALKHLIVWLKILMEKGYTSYNAPQIIEMTKQLNYKNKQLYEKRKNVNLNLITSCERCLMPTYGKQICAFRKTKLTQKG